MGGSVSSGSATISSSGNTLTVNQSSNKAVINWQGFNIAPGEITQFQQHSSSSIALNRISDVNPSQIDGSLTANGNIILINPNGVVFGKGSTVDVNGLVATTANISDSDFMNNAKPVFNQPGNPNGQIINNGSITVGQAGLAGLVAPHVENNGPINATRGRVALASGDTFTLDMAGDGITNVAISETLAQQIASNTGTINAPGGKGGFVKTSGKQNLWMSGIVRASAPEGIAGVCLMDPNNLTIIASGSTSNAGSSPNWVAGSGGGNVVNSDIDAALNAGTSVTLTASGSITEVGSLSKTAGGDATLDMEAGTDIDMQNSVSITSTSDKLNVIMDADTAKAGGAIAIGEGANITTNGGNISMYGQGNITSPAVGDGSFGVSGVYIAYGGTSSALLNAGGGNITLVGQSTGNGSGSYGVYIPNSTAETNGSGSITITGTGGASGLASNSYSVFIDNGSTVSIANGSLNITGTGGTSVTNNLVGVCISCTGNTASIVQATGSGTISITGTGGSGGTSYGTEGVDIEGASTVSTNSGNLTIKGTGGTASGGSNYGLDFEGGSIITSTSGAISVTGIGGSASSNSLYTDGTLGNRIGTIGTSTGNISLYFNDTGGVQNTGDFNIYTKGPLLVDVTSSSKAINVGGTTTGATSLNTDSSGASGALLMSELPLTIASSITFGDTTNTAAVTINYTTAFTRLSLSMKPPAP